MNEDIKNAILFHIPHSRTLIPDYTGYDLSLLNYEINLLTDFYTEDIFHVENIDKLIFPYSRIYCDVERLLDNEEPLYKSGRGFFYTHTDSGKLLRTETNKQKVFEIYKEHHNKFNEMVDKKLNDNGFCFIVDCHSFNNFPLFTDIDDKLHRPDICIGTNEHTPDHIIKTIIQKCEKYNFSYEINSPYSGSIVPLKHYQTNFNVKSVMIEINKKLYMYDNQPDFLNIYQLNQFINEIFIL